MPIATITTTFLNSNSSVSTFLAAVNTAMLNAGFTLIDSYVSSPNTYRVYNVSHGSNTYDTSIIEVRVNDLTFPSGLFSLSYSNWNATTNTGTNSSGSFTGFGIDLSFSYEFRAINHPEFRIVSVFGNSNHLGYLGILRPSNIPSWIDTNTVVYGFTPFSNTLSSISQSALVNLSSLFSLPSGNNFTIPHNRGITAANTENSNKRYLLKSPFISYGAAYIIGQFSSDLALVSAAGNARHSVYSDSVTGNVYTGIEDPAQNYILAIRTT